MAKLLLKRRIPWYFTFEKVIPSIASFPQCAQDGNSFVIWMPTGDAECHTAVPLAAAHTQLIHAPSHPNPEQAVGPRGCSRADLQDQWPQQRKMFARFWLFSFWAFYSTDTTSAFLFLFKTISPVSRHYVLFDQYSVKVGQMQSFWMAFPISVNKISAKGWVHSVLQTERATVIDPDIRLPFYWKKDWLSLYLNWHKVSIRNFLHLAPMQTAPVLRKVCWPRADIWLSSLLLNCYYPLLKNDQFWFNRSEIKYTSVITDTGD